VGRQIEIEPNDVTQFGAGERPVQCVASRSSSASVGSITRAGGNGGRPGLRLFSRCRPATASRLNRSCERHTHNFETPVRHDFGRAAALGCGEDVSRPTLQAVAIRHYRGQSLAVGGIHFNFHPLSHHIITQIPPLLESSDCIGSLEASRSCRYSLRSCFSLLILSFLAIVKSGDDTVRENG